jgi:hypothetical protein
MRRILVVAMTISLFCILITGTTAYGCEWSKSVYAANDNVSDTIIAGSGTYYPCATKLYWQDSFRRTSSQKTSFFLRFKYVVSTVYNRYDSDRYGECNYTNSGSECINRMIPHEIIISKSSWLGRGLWENMTGQAAYNWCQPEK